MKKNTNLNNPNGNNPIIKTAVVEYRPDRIRILPNSDGVCIPANMGTWKGGVQQGGAADLLKLPRIHRKHSKILRHLNHGVVSRTPDQGIRLTLKVRADEWDQAIRILKRESREAYRRIRSFLEEQSLDLLREQELERMGRQIEKEMEGLL